MKTLLSAAFVVLGLMSPCTGLSQPKAAGPASEIRLLVRGDDMGSFHAANLACIEAYQHGIMRSVELMVPGPWFAEAVKLLKENPGLDVGIHLVLTSEWETMKWGPKAYVPSLVDSNGFFFPMVWRNQNLSPGSSIQEARWQLSDIEKELRAQIQIALRNLPRITHLSDHMGLESLDPNIQQLVERLKREYRLQPGPIRTPVKYFPHWGGEQNLDARIQGFVQNIDKLSSGTYLFIEHPALKTPEMETVGHKGYGGVGADRDGVTKVYTSPAVMEAIRKRGVKLISYADLK